MPIARLPKLAAAGLLSLLVFACSDRGDETSGEALRSERGVLAYIPSDTPYAFAAATPLPDDVREKLAESNREVMQGYGRMLRAVFEQVEHKEGVTEEEAEVARRAAAVLDGLIGMVTPEGMPAAGIDRNSTGALYGVGLLPVLRVTLADSGRFEQALAELEARAGGKMQMASLKGHDYRYADVQHARFIVASNDDQLVATVVPVGLQENLLEAVLGVVPPAKSIAEAGTLEALAEEYGYEGFGLGFFDVERLASTFLDPPSGIDEALLGIAGYDASGFTDVCRDEIRSLAAIAPRFVAGYTEISGERLSSNTVVELRPDIATGLATLTAPVPGLGVPQEGLFAFGMSMNLLAMREFYSARLDALEAEPYECELFADLQGGVARGREMLSQPVPPIAYSFHGFLAVIDDIAGLDLAARTPPTDIDMRVLIATENAEGLLAMGAMFSPEIAALDLKPDGKPVKLPLPALAAPVQEAWVAMSPAALAISVGNGSEGKLEAMLAAAPAEPSPFMSMDMDAGRYYRFIGDAISMSGDAESPETVQATADMMTSLGKLFTRVTLDVRLTQRGIEIPSTVVLAD